MFGIRPGSAPAPVGTLGRFEFYDAARSPDLAIVTADTRTYANLLLTIGVRAEGTLTTRWRSPSVTPPPAPWTRRARTQRATRSRRGGAGPAYVGICGTDLHIFHGDMDARVAAPAVLGHEMSGSVVRVGQGVEGWRPGGAVTVRPLRWDDTCPACRAGRQHVCQHLDFIGIDSPGAMQQRWTVPASTLIRMPDTLPLDQAPLVEPTAVAVHDVGLAEAAAGERAVVVGGGPVGILIALVARAAGAEVRVVELSAHRRLLAEELGLMAWNPADVDVPELVRKWSADAGVAFGCPVRRAA